MNNRWDGTSGTIWCSLRPSVTHTKEFLCSKPTLVDEPFCAPILYMIDLFATNSNNQFRSVSVLPSEFIKTCPFLLTAPQTHPWIRVRNARRAIFGEQSFIICFFFRWQISSSTFHCFSLSWICSSVRKKYLGTPPWRTSVVTKTLDLHPHEKLFNNHEQNERTSDEEKGVVAPEAAAAPVAGTTTWSDLGCTSQVGVTLYVR